MKSYIFLSIFLLIASPVFLTSCLETTAKESTETTTTSTSPKADIPALLDRNKKIGSEAEQAYMTEAYDKLIARMEAKPEDMEPYIKMAQVFMVEARATGEHGYYYPAALSMIQKVLGNGNKNENENENENGNGNEDRKDFVFQALSLKASVLLSLHDFGKALEVAQKAAALNPYNAQIHGALVDAHVELGDYESAVTMSDKMVSIRPDLRSYSRISYLREIHGEVDGAVEALQMAIKAALPGSEESAWCYYTLGQIYELYDQSEEARKSYETILAQRENYPFAIAALGGLEAKKKNYEQAMELLDQACAVIPEFGFYEQKATIYKEQGETEKLTKITAEILEMLDDDEAHGHKMGMAYAEVYMNLVGDYKKAYTYAKEEYDARPENIDVNRLMARICVKMNKLEDAKKYHEAAKRTGSTHPELNEIETEILASQ